MPLQNLLVANADNRMNEVRPVAEVMADLVREYEEAVARLTKIRG